MAVVTLLIADRHYKLSCASGQEQVLENLGKILNEKAHHLLKNIGFIQENQLLLMLAVLALQEGQLSEKKRLGAEEEVARLKQETARYDSNFQQKIEKSESERQDLLRQSEQLQKALEEEKESRLQAQAALQQQKNAQTIEEEELLKKIENLTKRITALAEKMKKE